jgi:hypothetical protein
MLKRERAARRAVCLWLRWRLVRQSAPYARIPVATSDSITISDGHVWDAEIDGHETEEGA